MKRIAYVTTRFPFAPAEQFFEPEVTSLSEFFDVTVIPTRSTDPKNYYPDLPARPHYLGMLDPHVLSLALREFLRAPKKVLGLLGEVAFARCAPRARLVNLILFPKALAFSYDVRRMRIEHVHVNWLTSSATIAYVANRLTGVPFSMTGHQHDLYFNNLIPEKVEAAEFTRVISERNRLDLVAQLPERLHGKTCTIHLGVRLPEGATSSASSSPRDGAPRIICSARMCLWKGHRFLIPALAALRDRGVAFHCDLAGDGEIRGDVEKLVDDFELRDRVSMLGNVPHGKLVAALENGEYDLAVLASTEDGDEHEGVPVALMEAMAVGLPIVATRTGSIPELVDERCGVLVEQRDPAALEAAIAALLADPDRRRTLGLAGQDRVRQHFATKETTALLVGKLLGSRPWSEVKS